MEIIQSAQRNCKNQFRIHFYTYPRFFYLYFYCQKIDLKFCLTKILDQFFFLFIKKIWLQFCSSKKKRTYFTKVTTSRSILPLYLKPPKARFVVDHFQDKKIWLRKKTHQKLIFIHICLTFLFGERNSRFWPNLYFFGNSILFL